MDLLKAKDKWTANEELQDKQGCNSTLSPTFGESRIKISTQDQAQNRAAPAAG